MNKILVCISFLFAVVSCSNNDKVVKELIEEKITGMTGQEVIQDLLIENEGNTEQLARIFKCSKFTIERVKNKKTYLTPFALNEFKQLLISVKVTGKKTFEENDPYYDSWIRSFRYWLNDWMWWAISGFVLFFLIGISGGDAGFAVWIDTAISVVFIGGYLITWIGNMFWAYEQPSYILIQKINPVFEVFM